MKLRKIIDLINKSIADNALADQRFASKKINGIAITYESDGGQGFGPYHSPGVLDEANWVGFDDVHSVQIYHKNNGANGRIDPNKQTGNENNIITKTYNMSMIVMAIINRVQLSAEELDNLILSGIPSVLDNQTLKDFNLKGCSINYVATNYNARDIIMREYKGQNITVSTERIVFELKYTVECTFDKTCIQLICC